VDLAPTSWIAARAEGLLNPKHSANQRLEKTPVMQLQLLITPSGRLICELDRAADPSWSECQLEESVADGAAGAFAASSASGLLYLATIAQTASIPLPLVFWRGWSRRILLGLSRLDAERFERLEESVQRGKRGIEAASEFFPEPPSESELTVLIDSAPPMRGLEYLTPSLLQQFWREVLDEFVVRAGQLQNGCRELLRNLNPDLHLLGRVTLHLAENKRDPERPFAFLATWASRLSNRAQVQHLPLAEALRHFAAEKDQQKLAELLVPVRESASRCGLIETLLSTKAIFRPQAWTADQAWAFLQAVPEMERAGLIVRVPDWWSARRTARPAVQVRIGDGRPTGVGLDMLLDFSVDLALDGVPLTAEERRRLLAAGEGLQLLRGKWVEVNSEKLREALQQWQTLRDQHADGITLLEGMRLLAGTRLQGNDDTPEDSTGNWAGVTAGDWLGHALRELREPGSDLQCRPGDGLAATLRPYQAAGVRWLWQMLQLGLGACLADDMGLGKTIQTLAMLQRAKEEAGALPGPVLLVAPTSVVVNWAKEAARFTPDLRTLVHQGAQRPRGDEFGAAARQHDLVATSYALIRRDAGVLQSIDWFGVILDEAQNIKNPATQQTQLIRQLPATFRLALTGTPVENRLSELWSIMHFLNPGFLGSQRAFRERFALPIERYEDEQAATRLRRLITPFILRRVKTDPTVIQDLPEKQETKEYCTLSTEQATLYETVVRASLQAIESAEEIQRRGMVLAMLMKLKQICNHPAQFMHEIGDGRDVGNPLARSGKLVRLVELLDEAIDAGDRALIFSQFAEMGGFLHRFLQDHFGLQVLFLHGGTPARQRNEMVERFQQAVDGPRLFVLSLKAGGTGLNLTRANHVFHFDRWWNPAVEDQATDRAFRIGQKQNVLVHKFVCTGTLEEKIDAMIEQKKGLARAIVGAGEHWLTELSTAELRDLVDLRREMLA